jgi:spermidine synthase
MKSFPRYLSMVIGFLSLSQEILWVKLISFVHYTLPQSFSFVLVLYLLGIALGAKTGKDICAKGGNLYRVAFGVLLIAGVLDALLPLSIALPFTWDISKSFGEVMLFLLALQQAVAIILTSMLKGIIFPIAHHLGTVETRGRVGSSVSKVYFFNIIGSMLGPIVTGFYLLDLLDLQSCFFLTSAMTFVVAGACGVKSGTRISFVLPPAGALISVVLIMSWLLPDMLIRRIVGESKVKHVIQNRHGIIHTYDGGAGGDYIYGGGVYDGRFNTSLIINSNGINRAYMLATFHPQPTRTLMVGLSGASWTKVISGIDGVQYMDIVEINPGYLELIKQTPSVSSILADPRIHIHIDDVRRWLKLHPDAYYDLIVMNTTWHWKNFSSNLLSREFLMLVKNHLNPGGAMFYNSTGSSDVLKTAAVVFNHAYLYENFVIASDKDIRAGIESLRNRVYMIHLDGRLALTESSEADRQAVKHMFAVPLVTLEEAQAKIRRPLEVITDQNMITEFKYGQNF